jgi:GTPase SAR1 family protein
LSLLQLVVYGDQLAGKSSVLEDLTEILFSRNDNLCTPEIILRRAPNDYLTIKIIPDSQRPTDEQANLKNFEESITHFDELPVILGAFRDLFINIPVPNIVKTYFEELGGQHKVLNDLRQERTRAKAYPWNKDIAAVKSSMSTHSPSYYLLDASIPVLQTFLRPFTDFWLWPSR